MRPEVSFIVFVLDLGILGGGNCMTQIPEIGSNSEHVRKS